MSHFVDFKLKNRFFYSVFSGPLPRFSKIKGFRKFQQSKLFNLILMVGQLVMNMICTHTAQILKCWSKQWFSQIYFNSLNRCIHMCYMCVYNSKKFSERKKISKKILLSYEYDIRHVEWKNSSEISAEYIFCWFFSKFDQISNISRVVNFVIRKRLIYIIAFNFDEKCDSLNLKWFTYVLNNLFN